MAPATKLDPGEKKRQAQWDRQQRQQQQQQQPQQQPVKPAPAKPDFTWYRALSVLVVLLSTYFSPSFTNSFYGKALLGFANCVAYDQSKTMGQCLSNVLNGTAQTGAVPQAQQGQQQQQQQQQQDHQEVFHEDGKPQHLYDGHGGRVFPEAEKHRTEADHQAKLRGEKLGESQAAYQAGHKANAHELSVEGKRHGRLMEEANARAAKAILEPQNSGETGVLDLHGLYVKEAEVAAKTFLQGQRKAGRFREVEIITGTGHHSSDHQAKIRPAIEHLIGGLNLSYRNPPHNQGAFVVEY